MVRRAFTMMEVVLGVLLVGFVLAATIQLVGPTARSTQTAGDEVIAAMLADELIDEIASKYYYDPDADGGVLGPGSAEKAVGNRNAFDDVDDFDGWSETPQTTTGTKLTGLSGTWVRSVSVKWVNTSNPQTVSVTDTGVKRVTVTVTKNGVVLATRAIVRARAFDEGRVGE